MKSIARDPYMRSLVIQTIILRLNEKEAMYFFEQAKRPIADPSTWYKAKKKIAGERYKRIRDIFDYEYVDQYLQAIDTIKDCIKNLYQDREDAAGDPKTRAEISTSIINAQPLLIEFYHNVKEVITKDRINQVIQE